VITILQVVFLVTCTNINSTLNIDQGTPSENNEQLDRKVALQRTTAARITRIEDELKPLVIIKGKELTGFSLKERMAYYKVPGVSISVIHDGHIAWARGYGYANQAKGAAVGENTLFRAASISKPVTTVGALSLVDNGTLDLDEDVNRYLTAWQIPENEFTLRRSITLRQLLSHSAGLNDDPKSGYPEDEAVPTLVQVLNGDTPSKSAAVSVDAEPGTVTKYSNGGFCVVQLIMTEMTDKTFPMLMKDKVFDPLGMTNSTFEQILPDKLRSGIATGYYPTGEEVSGGPLIYPEMAAAGLWTTPSDLAKLLNSIGRSLNQASGDLLSHERANEMTTVQLESYGLGFRVEGKGLDLTLSHGGSNDGYRCYMVYYPEREAGAVVMTNSDSGMGLYYEILRSIAHEYGWPSFNSVEKSLVSLSSEDMIEFEGKYRMENGVVLTVSIENDHLRLGTGRNSYHLYPESRNKFFDIDFGFTMDFKRNDAGIVSEIVLDRGGVISTLPRIE
jgi:CubicO group peptidase (beta-lactamase class C family)